jgi:two-component system, cell cycle response regulator
MRKRILVADDEPLTAEMLSLIFSYRGYDVICAGDGLEALQRARAEKPDVILLDVIMPEIEGVSVTRALRCDPEFATRPVVLLSSADESEVAWREAGANMFLQKPVDIVHLPDVIGALIPAAEAA